MRIWHKILIPVLPNAQLKAMRYELGDMIKQYPHIKNRLVSYANNYDIKCLYNYFEDVLDEFDKRGIKHNQKYDKEINGIVREKTQTKFWNLVWFFNEHNDRYLKQNIFNLEEKYDRGIITEDEWFKILEVAYRENIIKEIKRRNKW